MSDSAIARHHSEWLSLIEVSGPFLTMPVLMRVFPQGLVAHDPEKMRTLRLAYGEWEANAEAGPRTNPAVHGTWIKYILTGVLGLPDQAILEQQAIPQSIQTIVPEHAELLRPSLVVVEPGTSKPRLLVQTYPLDQDLDKPVTGKTWKASPGSRMMELLHNTGVRLGLVTNGERWMLVDAPRSETTGFASWYANLWLEEPITLRAILSLLGAERFFGVPDADTLEAMLAESASNQQEVTDQLGYQVRRAVEVLVQSLDRADQDHDRNLLGDVDDKLLYEAALTVMMRLVFLFCAEERRLLPIDSETYATHYAASTMREQLRKTADDHGEEILERRHDAWCRLLACFRLVFGGCAHANLRMPAYGGHLFDPDRFPFLDGRKPTTSWRTCEADPLPVNNRTVLHLLDALQMLEVKMPGGEKAARRLSFRALDIEQIGHVYEGLLDHTAKRADEPMLGLSGGRDKEPEVPLSKLEELRAKGEDTLVEFLVEATGRSPKAIKKALAEELELTAATRFEAECGSDKELIRRVKPFAALVREDTRGYPVIIRKGSVFVTAGTDRRSSGTHYTPRSLTEPIAQYTLEPLVYIGPAEGKPKEQWQRRAPKELLDLKICDMACGSGAFLVQACRYLSERVVEAWEQAEKTHPGMPGITPEGEASKGAAGETLIPKDADERMAYAKRLVAQRCLYGVDINPLAAEMAKLSLWLLTLAKDKPFTFLDHSVRCGDSLLGIHDPRQLKNFSLNPNEQREWQFDELPLGKLVDEAVGLRLKIESMPVNTVEDVARQKELLREAEGRLATLKAAADYVVAAELQSSARDRTDRLDAAAIRFGQLHKSLSPQQLAADAMNKIGRRRFHWPLEFPEVVINRGGFHVFIGKPPFMGGQKITGNFGTDYRDYLVAHLANGQRGSADLCAYFLLRSRQLLRDSGQGGFLATNTIAQGDTREVGLDQLVSDGCVIPRAVPSRPWPGEASLEIAHVYLRRGDWAGPYVLDDRPTLGITPYLTPSGAVTGNPFRLKANEGKSFKGSVVLGMGFVLTTARARELVQQNNANRHVVLPYLNGIEFNTAPQQSPQRHVICFFDWPLSRTGGGSWDSTTPPERAAWLRKGIVPPDYPSFVAEDFPECLAIVARTVKPEREAIRDRNPTARDRANKWWRFGRLGNDLYEAVAGNDRVLVRAQTSKTQMSGFVGAGMIYDQKLVVFVSQSYHDLAQLDCSFHYWWTIQYGSSLRTDAVYTPSDCFETYPFLQGGQALEDVGLRLNDLRTAYMKRHSVGLTETYNRFHAPNVTGDDIVELRHLHVELDAAVAAAYGWNDLDLGHGFHETKLGTRFTISESARREALACLLKLNYECYDEEIAQGLHDKKKAAKPRATKTTVTVPEMPDMGLFAGFVYPATEADRAICAAALAALEANDGLSSMDHLDALLLATHPEWCAAFLDGTDVKALKRAVKAAPKALVVNAGTPINWKQCRDHLERRGAIRVVRGEAGQPLRLSDKSAEVAAVKASLIAGTEGIVKLALKALGGLKALKQDVTAASEAQKKFVLAIQREEQRLELVA